MWGTETHGKACPGKKGVTQLRQAATTVEAAVVSVEVRDVDWKNVGKKGRKTQSPLPQQDVLHQSQYKKRPETEKQH